jgi:hypothetical protein
MVVEVRNLPEGPAIQPDTNTSDAAYEASLRRSLARKIWLRRDLERHHWAASYDETIAHLVALTVHLEKIGKKDKASALRSWHNRTVWSAAARRAAARQPPEWRMTARLRWRFLARLMALGARERKAAAVRAYRVGDYARAESMLGSLIKMGFEVPSTRCDLVRILIIQDRFKEAVAETEATWEVRSTAPCYVVSRVLWLHLALIYAAPADAAEMARAQVILGRLTTALACEGAHAEWGMDPVLAHLRPRLPAEIYQLLAALVAALNDATNVPGLDLFPAWRDALAEPLE